jgi:hypothetical protein
VWQQDATTQFRLRIEPIIGHRKIDTVTRSIVTQMMTQIQRVLRERNPENPYEGHATVNSDLELNLPQVRCWGGSASIGQRRTR